jgi:hypothetical protein
VCFVFLLKGLLFANPFEIDFPQKIELTNEDYLEVQKQLSSICIDEILEDVHHQNRGADIAVYENYFVRCGRGLRQVMTAPEKGIYPENTLYKINNGGDFCIVTCAPLELHEGHRPTIRYELARSIRPALEASGFNGYFLLRTGGYPNPTGEEIRFAGVPYAFKIFMMLEAKQLGFDKVIWIDSACTPLVDPKPLFDVVEKEGAVFFSFKRELKETSPYIFPTTRQILKEETGVDCLKSKYVCSIVFGLNMGNYLIEEFIDNYYRMVRLGTPFLSCFPEEFVFSVLLGERKYQRFHHTTYWDRLFGRSDPGEQDTPAVIQRVKREGCFFFQRQHR